jgi:hypothetical protein
MGLIIVLFLDKSELARPHHSARRGAVRAAAVTNSDVLSDLLARFS